jgi:hypothetical protein
MVHHTFLEKPLAIARRRLKPTAIYRQPYGLSSRKIAFFSCFYVIQPERLPINSHGLQPVVRCFPKFCDEPKLFAHIFCNADSHIIQAKKLLQTGLYFW